MELIYAYIGKYRTFENQEISFSDKFHVSYDDEKKELTIERNPNYFDLYPGNIVGVSAILGKNAVGKSSLLDLIGKKIRNRKRDQEIWEQRDFNDPHKKISIFDTNNASKTDPMTLFQKDAYRNHYFLIYYYGKNAENQDLYIFESDAPYLYMDAFVERNELRSLDYYAGKGWISFVFLRNKNCNQILEDTQDYMVKEQQLQRNISIIRFLRRDYRNVFDREQTNQEENEVISVWRRYASLNNLYLYKQIDFLIENMKKKSPTMNMYSDDHYTVNIHFSDTDTFFDELKSDSYDKTEAIPDYRDFIFDSMEEEKKIVLAVLWHYTWFLFQAIIHPREKLTKDDPRELILKNMCKNDWVIPLKGDYAQAKDLYHQKIFLLLENDPDREYRNVAFSDIAHAEKALENFLENASACNIAYKYTQDQLSFTINKDTELDKDLHSVKSFFDDFLDEPIRKNMEQEDSLLGGFFKIDIQFFSDGEKENLAMFTSIDEQIRRNYAYKKKYILLFDEIERSMHPELCRNLVSNLVDFFQQYYPEKEFQIIIASHSPFIAGDIQQENIVLLERSGEMSITSKPEQSPFGQNIHTILKTQFFLDSTFGAHAETVMTELEKWLTSEQIDSTVTEQINAFLQGASAEYKYEKTCLTSTEETIRFLQTVIDNIGEPVLRNYFQRLLNRQKKKPVSRDTMIQYYEQQLEELRRLKQQEREQAEVKRYD